VRRLFNFLRAPQMHEAVRAWVREHVSPVIAAKMPILYGGATDTPRQRRTHIDR
jgi:triosephosphate isomerase